jgi:murein DD-endopeptidase MepM/ murein hydrolase activator NlpD
MRAANSRQYKLMEEKMKRNILKFFTVIMSVVLTFTAVSFGSSAATADELRRNINKLEEQSRKLEQDIKNLQGKINSQQQLKNTIEQKIAVVQQQINLCNNEIAKINTAIAANKAEMDKCNTQIEEDKETFKRRLRAIYMSNTGSSIQVLLGADSFADFLQLSQLTASVSARDKLLIEQLVAQLKKLEEKQAENNRLLEQQLEIKQIVSQKQAELQAENRKIQNVISQISADQKSLKVANDQIEKQIREYNKTLASMTNTAGTSFVYDGGEFLWPTPGYYKISAGFQSNDPVHKGTHNGIDITGNGKGVIAGAKIIAIADGIVTRSNNSCSHNYPKTGSCGCGGGYGNYVTINHGTKDGKTYVVTYGHMSSAVVSPGAIVKKGQTIGYVGTTGWSTGYHLHFGIAVNGVWQNPMNFYRKVG